MLQQTRVAAVIPYYKRWLEQFPTVFDLADAPVDDVLHAWAGLGYYSRARNLHKGAKELVTNYQGRLPQDSQTLQRLPGIGRYTAGAIASVAFGKRSALVDGNVARVLSRVYAIGDDIKKPNTVKQLWQLADTLVPSQAPGDFNQGLMELGALVCTPRNPKCNDCPITDLCAAYQAGYPTQFPVTKPRIPADKLPALNRAAAWIERNGQLLLMRRNPTGLYGGLWELPAAATKTKLIGQLPITITTRRSVAQHRQILTHRRLCIKVWQASLEKPARQSLTETLQDYDKLKWQRLSQLDKLATSTATQTIIRKYWESDQWNKTTRH